MQPNVIDQLVNDIRQRLPQGLGQLGQDIEHNIQAVLKEGLARLDLVSREEFDIQQQVLARTRAKLETLEKQVTILEQQLRQTN